jgi:hypothetical protein
MRSHIIIFAKINQSNLYSIDKAVPVELPLRRSATDSKCLSCALYDVFKCNPNIFFNYNSRSDNKHSLILATASVSSQPKSAASAAASSQSKAVASAAPLPKKSSAIAAMTKIVTSKKPRSITSDEVAPEISSSDDELPPEEDLPTPSRAKSAPVKATK